MYQEIRKYMKTGDLLAFSGKGAVSDLIKWKTNSEISHVGIVFSTNFSDSRDNNNSVLMIESTSLLSGKDALNNELIKGVQMHFLSNRIQTYNGDIHWYPLKNELAQSKKAAMIQWLKKKHTQKTPYDKIQAIGAGIDSLDFLGFSNEPDFNSLFCSELVAKAYQVGGIICQNINPSEQTPKDIISYDIYDDYVIIK